MIIKDNLIGMLEKSLANEDDFVSVYGDDFLRKLDQAPDLNDDQKREIKSILTVLIEDTKRHAKAVKSLIRQIQGEPKNEF